MRALSIFSKKIIEDASRNSEPLYLPCLEGELESYCDLDERHAERWHYKKLSLTNYTANSEVKIDDIVVDVLCEEHSTSQLFAIEIYRTHKKMTLLFQSLNKKSYVNRDRP
ncbi:hypothetical protein ACSZMN_10775 [Aeromonas veronii]